MWMVDTSIEEEHSRWSIHREDSDVLKVEIVIECVWAY